MINDVTIVKMIAYIWLGGRSSITVIVSHYDIIPWSYYGYWRFKQYFLTFYVIFIILFIVTIFLIRHYMILFTLFTTYLWHNSRVLWYYSPICLILFKLPCDFIMTFIWYFSVSRMIYLTCLYDIIQCSHFIHMIAFKGKCDNITYLKWYYSSYSMIVIW